MMRSLHIMNSSDLPLTRNMPFASNSVPTKNTQPRNMTGIYLGLEGNSKPPAKTTIPPLARGRGMTNRIRTPTEHRRYKMVEQLRIKEEKRGFVGQPVKRKKSAISPDNPESPRYHQMSPRSAAAKQWGPGKSVDKTEFFDLVRTNPRNYTVVVNDGVTRSENLSGLMSFAMDEPMQTPLSDMLAEEVHRISFTHPTETESELNALEECYKKVCRGKIESLQSLLPYRRNPQRHSAHYSTGFTVRSYRNPNQADIMADFSDNGPGRPKTVPASLQRPLVPSPYFFRHYSNPYVKQGSSTSAKSRKGPQIAFEDQFSALSGTSKVLAAPGAGTLTRSLKSRTSAYSESDVKNAIDMMKVNVDKLSRDEKIAYLDARTDALQAGAADLEASYFTKQNLKVSPRESTDDLTITEIKDSLKEDSAGIILTEEAPVENQGEDPEGQQQHITVPVDKKEAEEDSGNKESERNSGNKESEEDSGSKIKMDTGPSGKDSILVGVQNEHGKDDAVDIDTNEEQTEEDIPENEGPIKGNLRKASISEKVEKFRESEAYIATIKENAEQRKKQFERMLSEHAELVEEIGRATAPDVASDDRDH